MKKNYIKTIILLLLITLSNLAFGEVTILAASSLINPLNKISSNYKDEVTPLYGGSQTLYTQATQGVEADLFISANKTYIDNLVQLGLAKNTHLLASNKLVIITPKGSKIDTFDKFLHMNYDLGMADISVPIGSYTDNFLDKLNLEKIGSKNKIVSRGVSRTLSVRDLVMQVEMGAIDLAIVYATDVDIDNVDIIEIPSRYNVRTHYYYAILEDKLSSREFIDYITTGSGSNVLKSFGFTLEDK